MFKIILATTFAFAFALPATSALAAPTKDRLLSKVAFAEPHNAQVQQGKVVRPRLVGATLYVPAQAGL